MSNAYAGYFDIFNAVAGTTITNAYGVYIANTGTTGTITNRYDLYAASGNARSYFAGNVGIGTTTPAAKLEVNGTTKFDNSVTVTGLTSGKCVQAGAGGLLTTAALPCGSGGGGVSQITAGTDITISPAGGAGNVTVNVDTTMVPTLAAHNEFTNSNLFEAPLTVNPGYVDVNNTTAGGTAIYAHATDTTIAVTSSIRLPFGKLMLYFARPAATAFRART